MAFYVDPISTEVLEHPPDVRQMPSTRGPDASGVRASWPRLLAINVKTTKKVLNRLDRLAHSRLYQCYRGMWGVFVAGAPCMILANINPSIGLANGSSALCYSIVPSSSEDANAIKAASAGDKVIIDPPTAICITWPSGRVPANLPPDAILGVSHLGTPIVPILNPGAASSTGVEVKVGVTLSDGSNAKVKSHTIAVYSIPLTLKFAVTYHKVQGETLDALILYVTKYPKARGFINDKLNAAAVYVGLSRTRLASDIRIFPIPVEALATTRAALRQLNNVTAANVNRWIKSPGYKRFRHDPNI